MDSEAEYAKKLRQICDGNGKETKPELSAEFLHKIGQIYRGKSPDKLSLIQSAALLNAAILRKPANVLEVENDLGELCSHVLQLAQANDKKADLIKQARCIKQDVLKLREMVDKTLAEIDKMPELSLQNRSQEKKRIDIVENLQSSVSESYSNIMREIMDYCISVKGSVPCDYALVGMGSMARNEITPYSDFENVIVLENSVVSLSEKKQEEIKNYFRWVAVLFQIVLVNFGETILRFVAIPCLNNPYDSSQNWFYDAFTPCGISPDGFAPHACKNPLGRQQETPLKQWTTELIKPVSEMLNYLDVEQDLKNGYHLADILTKTCYVSGSLKLYESFHDGVMCKMSQRPIALKPMEEIKKDIDNFNPLDCLSRVKSRTKFDIKRVIYRSTTLFVAALGRANNLKSQTSYDIARELAEKKVITQKFKQRVLHAIAIACEIRLRVYSASRSQADFVHSLVDDVSEEDDISLALVQMMGPETSVMYFQTAMKLQRKVGNIAGAQPSSLKDSPVLDKLLICFWLELFKTALFEAKRFLSSEIKDERLFNVVVEVCLMIGWSYFDKKHFNNAYACFRLARGSFENTKTPLSDDDKAHYLEASGRCLQELSKNSEALEHYKDALAIRKMISKGYCKDPDVAMCNLYVGCVSYKLEEFSEAEYSCKQAMAFLSTCEDKQFQSDKALCNRILGASLTAKENCSEALKHLNEALRIREKISEDSSVDEEIASCYTLKGQCYFILKNHDEALKHLKHGSSILERNSNQRSMGLLIFGKHQLGLSLVELGKYDDALLQFKSELSLRLECGGNGNSDAQVAFCYYDIGVSLFNLKEHDKALKTFEHANQIWKSTDKDGSYFKEITACNSWIADALFELGKYEDSLTMSKSLLAQTENSNKHVYGPRAECNFKIARCYLKTKDYQTAFEFFDVSFSLWRDSKKESNLILAAESKRLAIECLYHLNQHVAALNECEKEWSIRHEIVQDINSDPGFAKLCLNKGCLLYKLGNCESALYFLQLAQGIWKSVDCSIDVDKAVCERFIADCAYDLNLFDNALNSFKTELQLLKKSSLDVEEQDASFAWCWFKIGKCHARSGTFAEAVACLEKAKETWLVTEREENYNNAANACVWISDCFFELKLFKDSLWQLEEELNIRNRTSHCDETLDLKMRCYARMGSCYIELGDFVNANACFEKCNQKIAEDV